MRTHRSPLKSMLRSPLMLQLASWLGLRTTAKAVAARGRSFGIQIRYRPFHTEVHTGGDRVLIPRRTNLFSLAWRFPDWDGIKERLVWKPDGTGGRIAHCFEDSPYSLPSGRLVHLSDLPEGISFLQGYFMRGEPKRGDVAVDVGAYCGEVSLELADRVGPEGRVIALEPDPKNLKYLRRNVADSGFRNIEILPFGLWNSTTELSFNAEGTAGSAVSDAEATHGIRIHVLSPRDLFERIGCLPNFLKMDIEGAEVEVIEAMAPLLRGASCRLAIASYHQRNGVPTSEIITPMLRAAGFEVETGNPKHQTTWAWPSSSRSAG